MKNIFTVSLLILFALICSCQKQDSAAEVQLAQQKAELDARGKALDERLNSLDDRVNSLDERVKQLAEKQRAAANAQNPADVQGETPDPAQLQAEKERIIQQISAESRSRMANDLKMKAEKERAKQAQRPQSQPGLDTLQSQRQRKLQMSSGAVFPSAETSSPTPSSAMETGSPSPSPAVEDSLPTASPTP
jgi:hypothetical protein